MASLSGIRVLDWTSMAAGPGAAALLSDHGASVIKVETPKGDPWRKVLLKDQPERSFGSVFEHDNRGKQSITLDLTCKAGRDVFHSLLAKTDVLVCNVRVAGTQRLGLDYESLHSKYPQLIYAHITAWGREGPMVNAPGYDAGAFWAATGMLNTLRSKEGSLPILPGAGGDHATSLSLVAGIALALFHRTRTNTGTLVDVSLLRSGLWCNGMYLSIASASPKTIQALKNPNRIGPTFRGYITKDQETIHLLGYQTKRHIPNFLKALNVATLPSNFELNALFLTKTANEWENIFDLNNVWYTRVMDIDVIAAQTEHPVSERSSGDMSRVPEQIEATHGFLKSGRLNGKGVLVASPIRIGDGLGQVNEPTFNEVPMAPELGEHINQVLLEIGWSMNDIDRYRKNGAFGGGVVVVKSKL